MLAITAALGRREEFHLHLSSGLDHGLEWSDVEEVLLQTAVYAGVPAANSAFKIAAEEQARRTSAPARDRSAAPASPPQHARRQKAGAILHYRATSAVQHEPIAAGRDAAFRGG